MNKSYYGNEVCLKLDTVLLACADGGLRSRGAEQTVCSSVYQTSGSLWNLSYEDINLCLLSKLS